MRTFSEAATINAPAGAVWKELADIGAIHKWNPGVVTSRKTTTGDDGLGSCRRCELGGKNYLDEEVIEWTPEKALTMRITATNLPFQNADIRFTLSEDNGQTRVTVVPSYTLKYGWIGRVLDAVFVRSRYRKGMTNLLRGLKGHVERRHAG